MRSSWRGCHGTFLGELWRLNGGRVNILTYFDSCQQKHSTTIISTKLQSHKITWSSHHLPSSNLFFPTNWHHHSQVHHQPSLIYHQASGCVLPSLNWLKAIAINEDPEAIADCKAFCMGAVGSWNTSRKWKVSPEVWSFHGLHGLRKPHMSFFYQKNGWQKKCSWHLTKRISSWALVLFTWFIIRSTRVIYTSIKDSRGSIRQPPLLGLRGKGARSGTTKSGRAQRGQMFFWFYDPEPKNTTYLPFSVPLCPVVGSPVYKTSCLPPAMLIDNTTKQSKEAINSWALPILFLTNIFPQFLHLNLQPPTSIGPQPSLVNPSNPPFHPYLHQLFGSTQLGPTTFQLRPCFRTLKYHCTGSQQQFTLSYIFLGTRWEARNLVMLPG